MDLNERVNGILKEHLGIDEIKDDSDFVADLGCDSLDVVELVMAVEEEFELTIEDDEAAKMTTPAKVVEWLRSKGVQG